MQLVEMPKQACVLDVRIADILCIGSAYVLDVRVADIIPPPPPPRQREAGGGGGGGVVNYAQGKC